MWIYILNSTNIRNTNFFDSPSVLKMCYFLSTSYLKGFSIVLILVLHYNNMHIFTFLFKEETNTV